MRFLLTLSLFCLCLAAGPGHTESIHVLVQSSPLAGSQYYALAESWLEMRVGDTLTLVRETDNRHDRNAIRIEWRGRKLGYLPRAQNRIVARTLDEGERLFARISKLSSDQNPWRRVEFEVYIEL